MIFSRGLYVVKDYSNVLTKDRASLYVLSLGSSISVRNLLQRSEVRLAELNKRFNYPFL